MIARARPAPPSRSRRPADVAFAAVTVAAGTVVAGALLSLLRDRSGSLAAPVLLHLAANCVAPLASALARTPDR